MIVSSKDSHSSKGQLSRFSFSFHLSLHLHLHHPLQSYWRPYLPWHQGQGCQPVLMCDSFVPLKLPISVTTPVLWIPHESDHPPASLSFLHHLSNAITVQDKPLTVFTLHFLHGVFRGSRTPPIIYHPLSFLSNRYSDISKPQFMSLSFRELPFVSISQNSTTLLHTLTPPFRAV